MNEIIDKLDFIKIKNCSRRTVPRERENKPQTKKKYLQNISNKELLSKIHQ